MIILSFTAFSSDSIEGASIGTSALLASTFGLPIASLSSSTGPSDYEVACRIQNEIDIYDVSKGDIIDPNLEVAIKNKQKKNPHALLINIISEIEAETQMIIDESETGECK